MAVASVAVTAPLAGCAQPSATAVLGVNAQIGVGITALAVFEDGLATAITSGKVTQARGAELRAQVAPLRKTLTDLRAAGGVDTANVLPATLMAITLLQALIPAKAPA